MRFIYKDNRFQSNIFMRLQFYEIRGYVRVFTTTTCILVEYI